MRTSTSQDNPSHINSSSQKSPTNNESLRLSTTSTYSKDRSQKKRILEISSLSELTFEIFHRTDMNLFNAEVTTVERKIISAEAYVIEISISNISPFKVLKVYEEFRVFYRALTLRFPNAKWPEFPSAFQLIKKVETRKKTFNEILERICDIARVEDTYRKSILSIFYAFFLEKGPIKELTKEPKKPNKNDLLKSESDDLNNSNISDSLESDKATKKSFAGHKKQNSENLNFPNSSSKRKGLSEDLTSFFEQKGISSQIARSSALNHDPVVTVNKEKNEEVSIRGSVLNLTFDTPSLNDLNSSLHKYKLGISKQRSLSNDDMMLLDPEKLDFRSQKITTEALAMLENLSCESDQDRKARKAQIHSNESIDDVLVRKRASSATDVSEIHQTIKKKDLVEKRKISVLEKSQLTFIKKIRSGMNHPHRNTDNISKTDSSLFRSSTNVSKTPEVNISRAVVIENEQKLKRESLNTSKVKSDLKEEKKKQSTPETKNQVRDNATEKERVSVLKKENETKMNDSVNAKATQKTTKSLDESLQLQKKEDNSTQIEEVIKEIPGFSGTLYTRLSSETKWNKYYAKLSNCFLNLYQSMLDRDPLHVVPTYRSAVEYIQTPDREYIELYHYYDAQKLEIVVDPEKIDQSDSTNRYKDLKTWHSQIVIASQKAIGLLLTHEDYQPIGKLQIVSNVPILRLAISSATNIKGLPKNSACYVRITHTPYTLKTCKSLSEETIKWKQSFFMPICDTFFPLTLELVCTYNNGWVKDRHFEEVICTSEIIVPDVLSQKLNAILTLDIPFKYTDQKKKQLIKSLNINEKDLSDPIVRIKAKNLSAMKSYFAPPYGDYVEGVKMETETYSKQFLKLSLSRVRRILTFIRYGLQDLNDTFHFKYPIFSCLAFVMMTWLIYMFEVSNLIPDSLFTLTLICIYKHPKVEPKIKSLLVKAFFLERDINKEYKPPLVITLEELTMEKNMLTAHWKFKLKDQDSLMTRLKRAKKSVVVLVIFLTKVAALCEKIKNLIIWDDPYRTTVFITLTTIGYCTFSVLSIRMILLFAVWVRFIKGLGFYQRLYSNNREVATNTLNFIFMSYFPDSLKAIQDNPNTPWPVTIPFNNFQKKVIEVLKQRLDVYLPNDSLGNIKTPQELISTLETSCKFLKFKRDPNEEASLNMLKLKKPRMKAINFIYFIMNVPSDYYRVIHPKRDTIDPNI